MSGDLRKFIEEQKKQILEEKRRMGTSEQKQNKQASFDSHELTTDIKATEVEKQKKNRVGCDSRGNNSSGKRLNLRENQENLEENATNSDHVKKCFESEEDGTQKNKENDPNFENSRKSDVLESDNNYNKNTVKNNEKKTLKNLKDAKVEQFINNENNNKNSNISSDHKSKKLTNSSDSELHLDLKELTEASEDPGNIIFEKNPYVDASIGKANFSESRLVDCEGLFGVDKSDASSDFHARFGAKLTPNEGVASMDYAPLVSRPILRRGEYSHHLHDDRDSTSRLRGAGSTSLLKAEPHCGLGEYELSRALFAERRRRDYLRHLAKQKEIKSKENTINVTKSETRLLENIYESPEIASKKSDKKTENVVKLPPNSKSVQTDIQNIDSELVQYDLRTRDSSRKAFSPRTVTDDLVDSAYRKRPYRRIDQRLTSAENELLLSGGCAFKTGRMDKPKSILSNRRTGSPRNRYGASNSYDDYESAYSPSSFIDGFSYSDPNDDLERERLKRENYQHDLRLQIEEKRRLQEMRAEQERRERELENKRLEQQILRIREEAAMEDSKAARRNEMMRRHSDDLMRRKHELQLERRSWRRHADSESGALDTLGLGAATSTSHYSPPVTRRAPYSFNVPPTSVFADSSTRYNPGRFESSSYSSILRNRDTSLHRMDSVNSYDTSTVPFSHRSRKFDRFDSLSRIDSLTHRLDTMNVRDDGFSSSARLTDIERRHSATQQDLSLSSRRSPRSRRRNSSSRFEDTLPVPVLKARSPVAKELKNSVPFSSARSSDLQRRLEDRWQIPAVQKTILHTSVSQPESPSGHQSRGSILTQLGAIRSQLQREQLRMDESLRRRGLPRARSTDYGGY